MSALTAGFLVLALQSVHGSAAPSAPARTRRGPIESRDEFLLAQPRLTLPAVAPDALGRGRTRVRISGDWGNDFGYRVGGAGGRQRLLYLVDGEHRSGSVQVSRGLSDGVTVEARLPVLWRGGGVMDGLIEGWHRLLGLPDGNRTQFPRDRLVVRALDGELTNLRWPDGAGSGLGGLELGTRWSSASRAAGWTGALYGRVQLPTATGGFGGSGVQVGAQAVAARTVGRAADLYLGAGVTVAPSSSDGEIEYAVTRPQGFVSFEWRPWRPVSLLAEASAAGRLVDNVESFPGLHVILRMGAKVDIAHGWRIEGGFTEGLKPLSATTDFGVLLGLERTF
jgi:hypothetical protein